jgi:retron-type reverse transcriptase
MLLEEILSRSNMLAAYDRVTGNKGAAGIDGVEAKDFKLQLDREWTLIKSQLETGSYQPKAVKRVTIPKPNGGERYLGIPKLVSYYLVLQTVLGMFFTKLISVK